MRDLSAGNGAGQPHAAASTGSSTRWSRTCFGISSESKWAAIASRMLRSSSPGLRSGRSGQRTHEDRPTMQYNQCAGLIAGPDACRNSAHYPIVGRKKPVQLPTDHGRGCGLESSWLAERTRSLENKRRLIHYVSCSSRIDRTRKRGWSL